MPRQRPARLAASALLTEHRSGVRAVSGTAGQAPPYCKINPVTNKRVTICKVPPHAGAEVPGAAVRCWQLLPSLTLALAFAPAPVTSASRPPSACLALDKTHIHKRFFCKSENTRRWPWLRSAQKTGKAGVCTPLLKTLAQILHCIVWTEKVLKPDLSPS